jgi:membrane-anchored glycerophosphoryl diester phosphodiesterase (GDPDase)
MEKTNIYQSTPDDDLKPGYVSSLNNAARKFKKFGWSFLLVTAAMIVFTLILYIPIIITAFAAEPGYYYTYPPIADISVLIIYTVILCIILFILFFGYILASVKAARGEKPGIPDLFRPFRRFFHVLFSCILLYLILFIGFILLIIPGIFLLCKLFFVPYLIVDQKNGVFGAISESWKMTRGHFWKIFLLGLTMFGLETAISFIVILITLPFVNPFSINYSYGDMTGLWLYWIISIVFSYPSICIFRLPGHHFTIPLTGNVIKATCPFRIQALTQHLRYFNRDRFIRFTRYGANDISESIAKGIVYV